MAGGVGPLLVAACCLAAPAAEASAPDPSAPSRRGESYYEYSRALQAWSRRDLRAALEGMQRAVAADPQSADLHLELARLHAELGDLVQAEASARRAVDMAPDAPAPRRLVADLLFTRAGREEGGAVVLQETARAYREAVRLAPDDEEALLNLGKVLIALHEWPSALDALQKHVALAPGSEEGAYLAAECLMKLGQPIEAAALLERALQRRPDSLQLGVSLLEASEAAGRLEEALATGEGLLKRRPDVVPLRFAMARLTLRLKRPEEAVRHYEEAARVMEARTAQYSDADRSEIELRIVGALLDAGRVEEALRRTEAGAVRFPSDLRFPLRRGEALIAADRLEECRAHFEEVRRAHADTPRLDERISDVFLSSGARFERAGDLERAERDLRRAIEDNPSNGAALNYLGYMLAVQGVRLDEAVALIERALQRDPDNGAYLDSLGWAYFRKGDYARAERALATALSALPDEGDIHAHLGDLYAATGRREEAIRSWQQALDRGAENAEEIRARLSEARRGASPAP